MKTYVIGLDYGSDSVRAVLVDTDNGNEMASSVHWFQRWKKGLYCDPASNRFRQHPLDHVEGLEHTIKTVIKDSAVASGDVKGICIDTTGSSPVPVLENGTPLAFKAGFEENPNAMMILWKDHTAIEEAKSINRIASEWDGEDYTKYVGGIYSSEWFWAKIWHIIKNDEHVKEHAYTWMEHCDLMTGILIGTNNAHDLKRSRCAAGHKAMWHESWGGLPPVKFLAEMDPYLASLRERLYEETYTSDQVAGTLSEEWAIKLGLTTDTVVTVGTFDAHAGAVGAGAEEHSLVRVMGTSTCDIIVSSPAHIGERTVRGICGQVDGSVVPGLIGLEAGQSAFGDVLAWFKQVILGPVTDMIKESQVMDESQRAAVIDEVGTNFHSFMTKRAMELSSSEPIPVALDWINGRRTPDADQNLKSAVINLSLGTGAAHIYKALVEAICFGAAKIVERFESEGVEIRKIIGIGGVARKSPFIMQTLANVLNRPIVVSDSDYAPALGAAIYAAVAAGIFPTVEKASSKLASGVEAEYQPDPQQVELLKKNKSQYDELCSFVEHLTHSKSEATIYESV